MLMFLHVHGQVYAICRYIHTVAIQPCAICIRVYSSTHAHAGSFQHKAHSKSSKHEKHIIIHTDYYGKYHLKQAKRAKIVLGIRDKSMKYVRVFLACGGVH